MLNGRQILVLEDEVLLRKSICSYLEDNGAETYPCSTLEQAREILAGTEPDFALMDINLPDGNSLDLLDGSSLSKNTKVVVMTADGGIRTAIEAIRRGAGDYLSKPFAVEELPMVFSRITRESVRSRIREFEQQARKDPDNSLFAGVRMSRVRTMLDKILAADKRLEKSLPPVLIEGETGTGKSTVARWIHENGPRMDAPLIEVNCSTLPESLAESELFGHEKGAFTDARRERIGLFEAADGGTLFLDEISSLPMSLQAKVLTAIEDGHIRRVGGNVRRTVDVRLITASLQPLSELVAKGEFREDLYHRLNLLQIRIPPLREHPEDLPGLVSRLLDKLKKRYHRDEIRIPEKCLATIMDYPWPGNVRELIHELERSLIFSDSVDLTFEHLIKDPSDKPFDDAAPDLLNPRFIIPESGLKFEDELNKLTSRIIEEALRLEKGNVSAAARRLGVSRDFIRYRLED